MLMIVLIPSHAFFTSLRLLAFSTMINNYHTYSFTLSLAHTLLPHYFTHYHYHYHYHGLFSTQYSTLQNTSYWNLYSHFLLFSIFLNRTETHDHTPYLLFSVSRPSSLYSSLLSQRYTTEYQSEVIAVTLTRSLAHSQLKIEDCSVISITGNKYSRNIQHFVNN